MGLQELWFILIAALFLGFFILEGFDFGVGMLMAPFGMVGRAEPRDAEQRRRAALNTIGPVWDGNEVWLITAGGAMFAAFPDWYATVFSALYLPLLAILFGDDPARRRRSSGAARSTIRAGARWADVGIARRFLAACGPVGRRVRDPGARACRSTPTAACTCRSATCSTPTRCSAGWRPASLFAFYGAVFVALKTDGPMRDDAFRFARVLSLPAIVLVGRVRAVDAVGPRQGLDLACCSASPWSRC